jgi:hypothetical protein
MTMKRIIAALALTVGGFGFAACHTTNPETACREVVNNALYDDYVLVSFGSTAGGTQASCLLRDPQTFQQIRVCRYYSSHQIVQC